MTKYNKTKLARAIRKLDSNLCYIDNIYKLLAHSSNLSKITKLYNQM